jgi:hypothetical protein
MRGLGSQLCNHVVGSVLGCIEAEYVPLREKLRIFEECFNEAYSELDHTCNNDEDMPVRKCPACEIPYLSHSRPEHAVPCPVEDCLDVAACGRFGCTLDKRTPCVKCTRALCEDHMWQCSYTGCGGERCIDCTARCSRCMMVFCEAHLKTFVYDGQPKTMCTECINSWVPPPERSKEYTPSEWSVREVPNNFYKRPKN